MTGESFIPGFHVITVDANGFVENHYGEPDSKLEAAVKTIAGATLITSRTLNGVPGQYKVTVNVDGWTFMIASRKKGGFVAIAWKEGVTARYIPDFHSDQTLIEKLNALPDPFTDGVIA
ncbi:MAG: hypothetical protein F7C32_04225 [Desulfurococcales archaeon]|nr:hypothetical protein [Desulfurococcales archaeon]